MTWTSKRAAKGEAVGGGFFVHRRGKKSGRIRPSAMSFEHADQRAAVAEAEKLAARHPGETFEVFGRVHTARRPVEREEPTDA